MGKKKILNRFIGLFSVLLLFSGCFQERTPSLYDYQAEYGFSLEGIQIETVEAIHVSAFRDPWTTFILRMTGTVKGSDFDPELMAEGVTEKAEFELEIMNSGYRQRYGKAFLTLQKDGNYRSTQWFFGPYKCCVVIYEEQSQLYYIIINNG
jgi:hypothetical protein